MIASGSNKKNQESNFKVEWPTLAVALVTYAAFATLTLAYHLLPWWLLLPLGAYVVCLHGSLQHEAVHGHPTRSPLVNELMVFPSLWLWMPYRSYRRQHTEHHRDEANLTDPHLDPESRYLTAEDWDQVGPVGRAFMTVHNTLLGRLLLGPAYSAIVFWRQEWARLVDGDPAFWSEWLPHLAGAALVLMWALGVCDIPFWGYVAFFAYPGLSLTLLRSFLEHQASPNPGERTVIIEAERPIAFMFLNNNLHALHHQEPGLAWYRLPARFRAERDALLARNGGYSYRGYREVAGRYLLRPKEPVLHPSITEA